MLIRLINTCLHKQPSDGASEGRPKEWRRATAMTSTLIIKTVIKIKIILQGGTAGFVLIRGTIQSPGRPAKGELICWPQGGVDTDAFCDNKLTVMESDWIHLGRHMIVPYITLATTPNNNADGNICDVRTLDELYDYVEGARLLLENPVIRYPLDMSWSALPTTIDDFPPKILTGMPRDAD